MNRMLAWFAENHVAANLLMLLFLMGGLSTLLFVPVKTFPDIDIDVVQVSVYYPGAAPEEVEEGICVRIEEAIEGTDGIEKITSSATEGRCGVTSELTQGADKDQVLADIKNRVDGITTFPDDAEKPIISIPTVRRAVIDVALSGPLEERDLKDLAERVRDEIGQLPEITQAEVTSTRRYEISIEVPEAALRRHGLTFDDVARAVRRSSLDLPGGSIKTDGGEILLRSKGQAYLGEEFEELVLLSNPDGTRVRLRDVARVVDGFEDTDDYATFDGNRTALIRVFRIGDQDSLDVSSAVKAFAAKKTLELPDGVQLSVYRDSSVTLNDRLDLLLRNGRLGFALVFAMLALFLRLRLALWVALGVPISFAGAIWLFPAFSLSIDMISLFSFILVLGILVDDAVVVGENVYTQQEKTGNRLKGAIAGTQEVAIPVIFGVLTTIMTFTPMLLVPGPMGQVFATISSVVIVCLAFSLIESQLILPAHLAHAGGESEENGARTGRWRRIQGWCADQLESFVRERYRPFLGRALEWRYATIASGIACLMLAIGVILSNRLPFTFFPPIEADFITAQVTMPTGAPAETTQQALDQITGALDELAAELDPQYAPDGESLVLHVFTALGQLPPSQGGPPVPTGGPGGGSHLGQVTIELTSAEVRDISTKQVAQRWRELTGPVPDAVEVAFTSDLFTAGNDIDVQLQGPDLDDLRAAAERLKLELAVYPGVLDIGDSFRSGKGEVKLAILPSAETLGLSLQDLARQVRQGFYGEEAQRVQRGRDDVRVMVRYPEDQRRSLGDLEDMRVRTASGAEVPFGMVARAEFGRGYSTIRRADRQRVINVTAAIDRTRTTGNEVLGVLRDGLLRDFDTDYPGMTYSLEGQQREQSRAFGSLLRWYGIALFGVYALLAVPLRSYTQPFIVMSVIPLGLVGGVIGHLVVRVPNLSFMSIMGLVALSGVVVNASLVLVHAVNARRAQGLSPMEAVVDASVARFRPIFLTSVTTFVGLAPLMAETSMQAQFLIPMAVSLAFGVVFATLVTLLIVPALYIVLEDLARVPALLATRFTARRDKSSGARRPESPGVLTPRS